MLQISNGSLITLFLVGTSLCIQWSLPTDSYGLSSSDSKQITYYHNLYRYMVADGKVNHQPTASDIQLMIWNESLTKTLETVSNECIVQPIDHLCPEINVYRVKNQNWDISKMVLAWFNTNIYYDYSTDTCTKRSCMEYKRIVNSESNNIGCIIRRRHGYTFFVCLYTNVRSGRPYSAGKPCSACSKEYGTCFKQALCINKDICMNNRCDYLLIKSNENEIQGDQPNHCLPSLVNCTINYYKHMCPEICSKNSETCDRKCHINAMCIGGLCRCWPGFVGDGTNVCFDCSICDKNAVCISNEERCICNTGYVGNGKQCSLASSDTRRGLQCHKDAIMVHDQCVCHTGLFGDGMKFCFDCSTCDRNATCVPSQQRCICNNGFKGDGTTCRRSGTATSLVATTKMSEIMTTITRNGKKVLSPDSEDNAVCKLSTIDCSIEFFKVLCQRTCESALCRDPNIDCRNIFYAKCQKCLQMNEKMSDSKVTTTTIISPIEQAVSLNDVKCQDLPYDNYCIDRGEMCFHATYQVWMRKFCCNTCRILDICFDYLDLKTPGKCASILSSDFCDNSWSQTYCKKSCKRC